MMNSGRVYELEQDKERLQDRHYEALVTIYTKEVQDCIRWFKRYYPKRTIEWVSGMGACFWVLDGKILQWDTLDLHHTAGMWESYHVDAVPDRRAKRLLPLWHLFQSINDMTNVPFTNICTGDITMEDV